jgi:hypothetical protein
MLADRTGLAGAVKAFDRAGPFFYMELASGLA